MKTLLQRFAAWGTGLKSNIFEWARIKLTVLYLLIIVLALGVYSSVMYFSVLQGVRAEVNEVGTQVGRRQLFDEAIDAVQVKILIIDSLVFAIAAVGSYWLAGITLRPIRQSLEAQEAFSSDASHELRTPLSVMKTSIEVTLRGNEQLSDGVQKLLESNLEEIQKLSSLTTNLLELARGKEKVLTTVPLDAIVQQEVATLQPLAHEKHIEMIMEGKTDKYIMADEDAMHRVLRNVIANAITYTREGGSVSVAMDSVGKTVTVTIADTGIGINEHDLAHIFKRFYKADTSHGTTGSGLGLAIVKHIVEHHNGSIDVASTVGKGTVVTIALPVAPQSS